MALGVGVGLLIAAQLQSKPEHADQPSENARQAATTTIERLEAEQADLKREISELRAEINSRQQQVATDKSTLSGLRAELQSQQTVAGMVPVKGPGVRAMLDDSATKTVPADEDPAFYLVHEYHLRDVVNLLWQSGAEAVSINGERLVATSSIYCVGSTIMVNDTRMSPPFEILAVGDPNSIDEALANPNNLRSLKTRVKVYGVQFRESKAKELAIPAFNGGLEIKYTSANSTR